MAETLVESPVILALLNRLRLRLGPSAFIVMDHWEQDLCAVGIASPFDARVLVYISCYGEPSERFSYELELPPPANDTFLYNVAGRGSTMSFEELADVVSDHLGLARRDVGRRN